MACTLEDFEGGRAEVFRWDGPTVIGDALGGVAELLAAGQRDVGVACELDGEGAVVAVHGAFGFVGDVVRAADASGGAGAVLSYAALFFSAVGRLISAS